MEFTIDRSDRRLLIHDIRGSLAHARMLGTSGIITEGEAGSLVEGLESLLDQAMADEFEFLDSDEDVHTAVERRLGDLVGQVAGKLHTGRSRNDQVVLDLRLYLRESGRARSGQLRRLAGTLAELADRQAETVVASYTHLQQAQPTTLGHHLLAFAWPALRSASRFEEAVTRIDHSPLGSGASAGSSLPVDPEAVAAGLEMEGIMANSIDAVGSRDFVSEYVYCCAQAMVDLSRLAETSIIWSSEEFGWLRLADQVSTGSSALPHKRNPDVVELVRGRAATAIGNLTAILTLQKALPSSYHRDLQEDKRIVFHADDTLAASLEATAAFLHQVTFDPPPPVITTITLDLAEALVARGVPFREAHTAVGGLVRDLEKRGETLAGATPGDLSAAHSAFTADDLELLDPDRSVRTRVTPGSGSPDSVRDQVAAIRKLIG